MKMMYITNEVDSFKVFDEEVEILHGLFHKNDTLQIHIYNALDKEILNLHTAKSGFKLFQGNKKETYECVFKEHDHGTLTSSKNDLILEKNAIHYSFYSGVINNKDMLIGYEDTTFIFQIDIYKEQSVIFLKDISYVTIAFLYYIYFYANGKHYSPTTSFLNNIPSDMMNLL